MEQTKLDRINELARLAKERELTEAEPDGVKYKLPKRGEKNAKIVRFDQINKDK